MKIYSDFDSRPSGAFTYNGRSFIKVGPDCLRESELLRTVYSESQSLVPKVYASSKDIIVMQSMDQPSFKDSLALIINQVNLLRSLHNSVLKNPSWRLCSLEDYVSYCLRPISSSVNPIIYKAFNTLQSRVELPSTSVFIHGDATVSNSVGPYLIDLSVRPTLGDPIQDWSKLLFSALGFDIPYDAHAFEAYCQIPEVDNRIPKFGHKRTLTSPTMAFYFASNLIRVGRKETLDPPFLKRALDLMEPWL